jgi:hypothetical protein
MARMSLWGCGKLFGKSLGRSSWLRQPVFWYLQVRLQSELVDIAA